MAENQHTKGLKKADSTPRKADAFLHPGHTFNDEIEHTVVIGDELEQEMNGFANKAELIALGNELQGKYKDWIIQLVLKYFKTRKEDLEFDTLSPMIPQDKKKVFFTLKIRSTNESVMVVGDLNDHDNISNWRVGNVKE